MDLAWVDPQLPIDDQAAALASACETDGFFRLPLDIIDTRVADAAWIAAKDFFALSEKQKRRITFPEAGYPYGYSPFKHEALAQSTVAKAAAPDLKESLSVGPDCGVPTTQPNLIDGDWIRSPSLWPEQPASLRAAWTAYYRSLAVVCEHLMSVLAVAFDLPPAFFAPMIDRPISSMRALRYPEISPADAAGPSLRAGEHADYGTFTVLRTDEVPGLEIQALDGTWQPVQPETDSFVVNLGDSIAQWTNNQWRSTMHRVTATDLSERHSFAFFHMANWDAVIECLPTCRVDGEAPLHEPAVAGPWLMRKFQATVS